MKIKAVIVILILVLTIVCCLSFSLIKQQYKIDSLENQLQEEQIKYNIIINDPLARDAAQAGG